MDPARDEFDWDAFEFNAMTLGEIDEFEERTGVSIDMAFEPGVPRGKTFRACAWIERKRTDPEFTWEQAGALRMKETPQGEEPAEESAEVDPTSGLDS